jgi:hypothetical protein
MIFPMRAWLAWERFSSESNSRPLIYPRKTLPMRLLEEQGCVVAYLLHYGQSIVICLPASDELGEGSEV